MTVQALDAYFRSFLAIDAFSGHDRSLNGVQVDYQGEIHKVAFAVDACLESFNRCVELDAQMLFVHHGLFWGEVQPVRGVLHKRISFLLEHGIALYACHLPLDQHETWGNNAALAEKLGVTEKEPFGLYHGRHIGYKGTLAEPLSLEAASERIGFWGRPPLALLPFGKAQNKTVAMVSGDAPMLAAQAIDEDIDLYVTGECSHSVYHLAQEGQLNMLCGGHYATEIWGVRNLACKAAAELPLQTEFIDIPTGL